MKVLTESSQMLLLMVFSCVKKKRNEKFEKTLYKALNSV